MRWRPFHSVMILRTVGPCMGRKMADVVGHHLILAAVVVATGAMSFMTNWPVWPASSRQDCGTIEKASPLTPPSLLHEGRVPAPATARPIEERR